MKCYIHITLAALLGFVLISCTKDYSQSYSKMVLGTWEGDSLYYYRDGKCYYSESLYGSNHDDVIDWGEALWHFREDGKLLLYQCPPYYNEHITNDIDRVIAYNYSIDGDKLRILVGEKPEDNRILHLSFQDDRMYWAQSAVRNDGEVSHGEVSHSYDSLVTSFFKVHKIYNMFYRDY